MMVFASSAMAQMKTYLFPHAGDTTQGYYLHFNAGNKKSKAILICPGGGYGHVAMQHEGVALAKWLNALGFDAYVLHYRVSNQQQKFYYPSQLKEVSMVMDKLTKKYRVLGVVGWSAGGHLAGTYLTSKLNKAKFGILLYPVISSDTNYWHRGSFQNLLGASFSTALPDSFSVDKRISKATPPLWLMHCKDDGVVPCQNAVLAFDAAKKYQRKAKLELFENGGHGFGMRALNNETDTWKVKLSAWLKNF